MDITDEPETWLRAGEAAKLTPFSTRTLSRLADAGLIRFIRPNPDGNRWYSKRDVERIARERAA